MIKKYIKKPIPIEAIQYTGDNLEEIYEDFGAVLYEDEDGNLFIRTLEGNHYFGVGDYIIKGVFGEYYPCKKDIFKKTYECVE